MNASTVLTIEVPLKARATIVSLVGHLGGVVLDNNNYAKDMFDDDNVIPAEPIPDTEKAGAMIRGLRIREGLTQKQLAEMVGETQAHISEYENNMRKIPRSKRAAFARALNSVAANFIA